MMIALALNQRGIDDQILRRRSKAYLDIEPSNHDSKLRYVGNPIKLDVESHIRIAKQEYSG